MDKAREHGLTISFDPNLRPQLWPDQETMAQVINALAARLTTSFRVLPRESSSWAAQIRKKSIASIWNSA